MKRITPWLCLLSIASYLAGCDGAEVDLHFDHDASFAHDAGDAGDHGGAGASADDDGGAVDDEDAGTTQEPASDGGSHPSSDAGTTQSSAAAFPAQLARATCDALEDCLGSAQFLADQLGGRDCASRFADELSASDLRYLSDSIAAGLVKLHADRVDECLADVRALGCDVRSRRLPASCKAAFAGTGLAASECTTDLDCMGDAFCSKDMDTCPGVCTTLLGEGKACTHDDDAQCQDGLVCFSGSHTCETLGASGQECGGDLPGCKPGLICVDQGDGPGCAAPDTLYARKLGEDCDAQSDLCAPGLVCESLSDAAAGSTAGKCAEPVGRDESCKRAQPNQCPVTQYCDAVNPGELGTCVDRPGDGEACRPRAPRCADGYACFDDTCRPLSDTGEPCTDNSQCLSGTCSEVDEICDGTPMCPAP